MASIAFGLSCFGCLLLSMSLRRHYGRVFVDASAYERHLWPLRLSGYGCLLLALWACIRDSGPWIGLVLGISLVAPAAFLQTMVLTYRPRASSVFGGFGMTLIALGYLL